MAFTATTEWDVRTTGSDSNGGAFDTASTGTDYSQRDTPLISYTDLVIGSTNTQLTSAANPFTAAHVGNIINVTGGTGFTVQRVQVVSVSHRDGGTKPLLTTSTNSLDPLVKGTGQSINVLWENIQFTNTAATPSNCFCQFTTAWTAGGLYVNKCKLSGFTAIFNDDNIGSHFRTSNIFIFNSELSNSQQVYTNNFSTDSIECHGCYIHDMTTTGATNVFDGGGITLNRCVLTNSASAKYFAVVSSGSPCRFRNSVFYKSGGSAVKVSPGSGYAYQIYLENCAFYGSTTYDLDALSSRYPSSSGLDPLYAAFMKNNAFGGSGSGAPLPPACAPAKATSL